MQVKFIHPEQPTNQTKNAAGFTDGKIIWINMFCSLHGKQGYTEDDIELELNYVFTHELIHTIDMKLSEKKVTWAGNAVGMCL